MTPSDQSEKRFPSEHKTCAKMALGYSSSCITHSQRELLAMPVISFAELFAIETRELVQAKIFGRGAKKESYMHRCILLGTLLDPHAFQTKDSFSCKRRLLQNLIKNNAEFTSFL